MRKKLRVSVGIFAYNEENNIERLLSTILKQKLQQVEIAELLVISSGSTDNTNKIVKKLSKQYPVIQLVSQKKRLGKASAVNLFLEHIKEQLVIVSSADILLASDTIEKIVLPLKNEDVGIVGCRPIPLNNPKDFFGFTAHLLWNLHHEISLRTPKMGEFIAFRKVFKRIPVLSGVDEVNIEALIRGQGYKVVYEPDCIIYNKGAENLKDFVSRRKYIYAGHLATKYEYSYEVSTIHGFKIIWLLLQRIEFSWRFFLWTPAIIVLEAYSRLLGFLDYKFRFKPEPVWEIAVSTKTLPQLEKLNE